MKHFNHLLRIRFATHHAKCGQCLRHRLILRKLGHNPAAWRAQRDQLDKHLTRQHADRQVYWHERARSRLAATTLGCYNLCCILDSMDQAKHAWPRSQAMQAKAFNSWGRPRLISTTLIAHGHMMLTALSPHHCSANSSRSCEIVSHALSLMEKQRKVDLSMTWLHLQGDNCSKELKNLTVLRLIATAVARRRLQGGTISFLSSGHSHEDIDAFFSLLRGWFEKHTELWVPDAFRACIDEFYKQPGHRPFEPFRRCLMMTRYRGWRLDLQLGFFVSWLVDGAQETLAGPCPSTLQAGGCGRARGAACVPHAALFGIRTRPVFMG